MAYRRSIIARTMLFYQQQQQRFAPSFSHISSSHREEEFPTKSISRNSEICSNFLITRNNAGNSLLSGNVSRSKIPAGYGLVFHRNFSKVPSDIEVVHDAAPVVGDKAVEAALVVNEVAVAASDSFAPVAAFQYLIDYVHCYTGLGWWASIAATTLVIRFIELPFLIHQLQFNSKNFKTLQPQVLAIQQALEKKEDLDFKKVETKMCKLVKKFGEIQLLGLIIADVNVCILLFAILNMAEKVPSFATGGALWFTDLTTPDHIMCLPLLFALTLWLRMELKPRLGVEGFEPHKNKHKFYAAVALLGAVTAGFPSAIYCYGITTNLFSIAYGIVVMDPQVQKLLGLTMKPPRLKKNKKQ